MPEMDEDVMHLLRSNFPKPEDGFDISELERFNEVVMQNAAYEAVHVNDRYFRDSMRGHIMEHLMAGASLTVAERAWLVYVLRYLKDTPHENANGGRPVEMYDGKMFLVHLLGYVVEYERLHQGKKINKTKMLEAATREFFPAKPDDDDDLKAYSKVKSAYYSKSFARLKESLQERGILNLSK